MIKPMDCKTLDQLIDAAYACHAGFVKVEVLGKRVTIRRLDDAAAFGGGYVAATLGEDGLWKVFAADHSYICAVVAALDGFVVLRVLRDRGGV